MIEMVTLDSAGRKKITARLKRKSRRKLFSYERMNGIIRDVFKIKPGSTKKADEMVPIDGGSAGQAFIALVKHAALESLPLHAYYSYDQSFLNEHSQPLRFEKMVSLR